MCKKPLVSDAIVHYIKSQNLFDFEPKLHHYLVNDLNFDSLDIIELSIHLEELYDIQIEDSHMYRDIDTLAQLSEVIRNKYGLE